MLKRGLDAAAPEAMAPDAADGDAAVAGAQLNSLDTLALYKLQMRAVPELIEQFQTVPELSDFALGASGGGSASGSSGKSGFLAKIKSVFALATFASSAAPATSSKRTGANETTHAMPMATSAADADAEGRWTLGMQLEILPATQVGQLQVPTVLHRAFEFLRAEGRLDTLGLFRKSGLARRRKLAIRCMLNDEPFADGDDAPTALDVADAVKEFLRELPERLVNNALSPIFVAISIMQDYKNDEETMRTLQLCHLAVPTRAHRDALHSLAVFLADVASHQSQNKMDPMALAKCVVPNLFHLEDLPDTDIALFYERAAKLLARMIAFPGVAFQIPKMSPASASLVPAMPATPGKRGTPSKTSTPKSKRQRTGEPTIPLLPGAENSPPTPVGCHPGLRGSPKTPKTPKTPSTPKTPLARLAMGNAGRTPSSRGKGTPAPAAATTPSAARSTAAAATPSSSRTVATRSKLPFPFNISALGSHESLLMPRGVKAGAFGSLAAPLQSVAAAAASSSAGSSTPGRMSMFRMSFNFTNGAERPQFH